MRLPCRGAVFIRSLRGGRDLPRASRASACLLHRVQPLVFVSRRGCISFWAGACGNIFIPCANGERPFTPTPDSAPVSVRAKRQRAAVPAPFGRPHAGVIECVAYHAFALRHGFIFFGGLRLPLARPLALWLTKFPLCAFVRLMRADGRSAATLPDHSAFLCLCGLSLRLWRSLRGVTGTQCHGWCALTTLLFSS